MRLFVAAYRTARLGYSRIEASRTGGYQAAGVTYANDGVVPFPFHNLRHAYAVTYLKTPLSDGSPASI